MCVVTASPGLKRYFYKSSQHLKFRALMLFIDWFCVGGNMRKDLMERPVVKRIDLLWDTV